MFLKKKYIYILLLFLLFIILSSSISAQEEFKYQSFGGRKLQLSPRGLIDYWKPGYPNFSFGISKHVFLNCNFQLKVSYAKFKYKGWDSLLVDDVPVFHGFRTTGGGELDLYGISTNLRWKYGDSKQFFRLSLISGLSLLIPRFSPTEVGFFSDKFDPDRYQRQTVYLEDRLNNRMDDIFSTDIAINIGPRLDVRLFKYARLCFEFRYNVTLSQSEAVQFVIFNGGLMIDPQGNG